MAEESKGTLRQMYKQIGRGDASFEFEGSIPSVVTVTGQGWEYIPQANPSHLCIVNRNYIDLSGYTQRDLTLFTSAIDFQHNQFPSATVASGPVPNTTYEYDIISTRRLTTVELSDIINTPPGYLLNTLDLMEVIYGESVISLLNTNITSAFVPTYADSFGSGNPTAADKLHWTRILLTASTASAAPQTETIFLGVGSCNLVVSGITVEEKDLVYIERLRRAYTQERS